MDFNEINFPWGHSRRFNSYKEYFTRQLGGRVQKISVDAGFTCPNRDGTKGTGGCTYCSNDAFQPSYCQTHKPISQQINEGIEFHKKRYRRAKNYLVYFQSYTNTYKPLEQLMELYQEALSVEGVVGLVIGTRPDAVNDAILSYLEQIQKSSYIILEFGIETAHEKTLKRINRGHTFEEAAEAICLTASKGIPCGGHLIFGLPGETRSDMFQTISKVNLLPLNTIKFHQLQLFKGTKMAAEYVSNPSDFELFSLSNYIDFIIEITERLNPNIVIERFAGEVPPRFLVSPLWGTLRYDSILNNIEKKLAEKSTYQGRLSKL